MCRNARCRAPGGGYEQQYWCRVQRGNCALLASHCARPARSCWRHHAAIFVFGASPGNLQVIAQVEARREVRKLVWSLLEAHAVSRFLQNVRNQPVFVVDSGKVGPDERTSTLLALER